MRYAKNACTFILLNAGLFITANSLAATIDVDEDVMTSAFFTGGDDVRGYAGDNRSVHRVSTDNAFGLTGAETVYLTFNAADFSSFSSPVSALLTMESVSGGFGADAGADNPFVVSAHAVNADPLSSITDNTNPGGTTNWLDFYSNNILDADAAALTTIDSFGTVTFDVSAIVNDWLQGANTIFAIALTGKNDFSGNDILHGFLNNTENPGSTFLSVTPVPVPAAVWLFASALLGMTAIGRPKQAE